MDSLTQLRKIAQGFPAQETGGDADIDEDEVPSEPLCVCVSVQTRLRLFRPCREF